MALALSIPCLMALPAGRSGRDDCGVVNAIAVCERAVAVGSVWHSESPVAIRYHLVVPMDGCCRNKSGGA